MALPYVRSGAAAKVEVVGMAKLIDALNDASSDVRVRRFALKAIAPGAKILRDSIRAEAPVAKHDTGGRYAHKRGALKRGVRYKASRQRIAYGGKTYTGKIIAYVVGPFGKGTAQRHLVVGGHAIKGHSHSLLGVKVGGHRSTGGLMRTRPNPFVERGEARARTSTSGAIESGAKAAFEELTHA
jgi:hypothetical protein